MPLCSIVHSLPVHPSWPSTTAWPRWRQTLPGIDGPSTTPTLSKHHVRVRFLCYLVMMVVAELPCVGLVPRSVAGCYYHSKARLFTWLSLSKWLRALKVYDRGEFSGYRWKMSFARVIRHLASTTPTFHCRGETSIEKTFQYYSLCVTGVATPC